MKTLKFKHTLASGGQLSPQHPHAKPGHHGQVVTLAVHGLPDDAIHTDAKLMLEATSMPSWVHEIDASQSGKNLHRVENLLPWQLDSAPDWYRQKYLSPA